MYYFDAMDGLMSLQESGLIKNIGLTNFDTKHMEMLMDEGAPIVSNQVSFSVLDTRPLEFMVPFNKDRGVKLLCYGSLLGRTNLITRTHTDAFPFAYLLCFFGNLSIEIFCSYTRLLSLCRCGTYVNSTVAPRLSVALRLTTYHRRALRNPIDIFSFLGNSLDVAMCTYRWIYISLLVRYVC